MKKMWMVVLLSGAFMLLVAPSLFAQWESDVRLTDDNSVSYTVGGGARCIAAQNNYVHVTWWDNRDGNAEIYYKRSQDNGVSWNPDRRLSFNPDSSKSPSIVSSGSYVYIFWKDSRYQYWDIFYRVSSDNGSTWTPETRLPTNAGPVTGDDMGTIALAASSPIIHVVWCGNYGSYLYDKVSTDNGGTWQNEVSITGSEWGFDYPAVTYFESNVLVPFRSQWDYPTERGVWFCHSANNGSNWSTRARITPNPFTYNALEVSATYSGALNHLVWADNRDGNVNMSIYYDRTGDWGQNWKGNTPLTSPTGAQSPFPSVVASWSNVHTVWTDYRDGGYPNGEIYYKVSPDQGDDWSADTRLTSDPNLSDSASVAVSGPMVHVVWTDYRDSPYTGEIYYKRNPTGNPIGPPFVSFKTDSSNGRHLVRDPQTGYFHLVMTRQDNKVFYSKSVDGFQTWSEPLYLGDGQYPTVGVAQTGPGYVAICVAYKRIVVGPMGVTYKLSYRWLSPSTGVWQPSVDISTSTNPGPPSLVISNGCAYVAYKSGAAVLCSRFDCTNPAGYLTETIDNTSSPSLPCLAVDGNGAVYGAWQRQGSGNDTQIWYAPRGSKSPYWSSKSRVDQTTLASDQPFVDCYGDTVFVVWSDSMLSQNTFDVWRAGKPLVGGIWRYTNVSNSSQIASESPTQAWREFTTWSESIATPGGKFDINYWRSKNGQTGDISNNPTSWSYWTHSQMNYNQITGRTELWSAWTESPNTGQSPFQVLTNYSQFLTLTPGPGDEEFGPYYRVIAGQDTPSIYCRMRDGVMRFTNESVDFARDSLVYELPYLDPVYDYYLKVYSYRETGNDWTCGLSFNGGPSRTVQFASNRIDTIRVQIPPAAYAQDRKVTVALKNLRGDYVTNLGLTLFQRDPVSRGQGGGGQGGGGQSSGPVSMPLREVFAVYPNPAKGQTQIEYSLKVPGEVKLAVYDVMGRLVRRVVKGEVQAGVHRASWDGKTEEGNQAPSGIYFLKLDSPGVNKTTRFVVVR